MQVCGKTLAAGALWLAAAVAACAAEVTFKKHTIDRGTAEGCCVADVNNDGRLDIICGDNWYIGPTWMRRNIRNLETRGEYKNSCADWPFDVDGDGDVDIITAGFFQKGFVWVENPGNKNNLNQYTLWKETSFSKPHFVETFWMLDIDGDKKMDILSDDNEPTVRWVDIGRDAAGNPTFTTYHCGKAGTGHGIGYGDVNGDGRVDILTPNGWYEGPADARKGPWPWHPEYNADGTGIPMRTLDVNGDGLNDILYGMGHNKGFFWLEQVKTDGKREWKKHVIDDTWTQVHTMTLVDLSGDGLLDVVTGKRYRAHNGHDPGGNDPLCVYWYELDRRNPKFFVRHEIDTNTLTGGGLQIPVVDIDKDGDMDILCPGKGGLYLFENVTKR